MTPFRMQERDLDLFILEELHSEAGFSEWLTEQLDLEAFAFAGARHSVSAKVNAKWGETGRIVTGGRLGGGNTKHQASNLKQARMTKRE